MVFVSRQGGCSNSIALRTNLDRLFGCAWFNPEVPDWKLTLCAAGECHETPTDDQGVKFNFLVSSWKEHQLNSTFFFSKYLSTQLLMLYLALIVQLGMA